MQEKKDERNTAIAGFGRLGMALSDCACEINADGPGVVSITLNHAGGSHVLTMDSDYADWICERLSGQSQESRRMCTEGL